MRFRVRKPEDAEALARFVGLLERMKVDKSPERLRELHSALSQPIVADALHFLLHEAELSMVRGE